VTDLSAMRLALVLAELGAGDVNPNPVVGAVVVKEGRVVGRGYHRRFGGPHAELFALDEAGDAARGSTLYVTLEPCSHHGKTPPCTQRIIEAGIARVVIGTPDPNPVVNGSGIAALRAAGLDVATGLLAAEAEAQNEIFATFVTTGRPFVLVKLAISLDGRIATRTGDSEWISSQPARTEAHRLRRRFAAVLVGVDTVLADDPELSVRHVIGQDPVAVVLDPSGKIPLTSRLLDRAASPIVVTASMTWRKRRALTERDVRLWHMPLRNKRFDLPLLLARLGEVGMDSVLVEGGGETVASFLEAGLVDKIALFIAPILIGGRSALPAIAGAGVERIANAWRLRGVCVDWVGEDLYITGHPYAG
jgi:diaminohydroxyphosphoribosylaminopyrimidine deaminase/5-amino-6-(5-phosphoribosylamino)uracil reductase